MEDKNNLALTVLAKWTIKSSLMLLVSKMEADIYTTKHRYTSHIYAPWNADSAYRLYSVHQNAVLQKENRF